MNKQSKFIPKNTKQVAPPGPPPIDKILLEKARQIAVSLVGFPINIEIGSNAGMNFYRMSADIELLTTNMIVYSYLKEFNIFYLKAHELNAPGKVTMFSDLISAIHDMGAYWAVFGQIDPLRFAEVIALCRKAMDDVNRGTVKLIQEQIQKS